ncbi:NAD-dependent dehydratase [Staphylococcus sp. HMSC068D03]|uniref:NAD-dependent dehydratase n=2 Tax=Staphylococcus haemolyticus TaxID=1283 RepID=A0A2K0A808_STAHA|nr:MULTISPECIES: SDR family oxidoreductase [Staphylococcus]SIJ88328.1 saccharopine dehydrogenase related protein [Mycobacteroides abscessus subsp. abscessus]KAA2276250.1 SDR family oxidoreductase [Staphylococcus sp. GDX7P312P]KAA2282606.1 SDR family oxidoreductase [Staphylococcus sp. GDX7P459A]KGF27492.1 NAD-dependent dehydratase [Staphylococcus haemolyticus DNF00585]KGJ28570.1 NAD-dependent dehydratase [Staphylococcus haemolyticus]
MQTVLIIGANGKVSIEATKIFLEDSNFNVDLFLRNAHRIPDYASNRVTVYEGDAKNSKDLEQALDKVDVVFASLSGSLDIEAQAIVDAMSKKDVKRLIFVAAPGIYDELPAKFNEFNKSQFGEKLTKYRKAADIIEASTLDYTIIRPAWLTFKNETDYEVTSKDTQFRGTEVSRRSIASLAVRIAKNPELYSKENIGVNKPNTDGDKPAWFN